MLKKFLIFWAIVGVVIYFTWDFLMSGKCQDFILSHSKSGWAPGSLYYLGNMFLILQKPEKAEQAYGKTIEIFPDSKYHEPALYKYFYLAADYRKRKEARERGSAYLEKFPDSPGAERVRKRLDVLEKF